MTKIGHNHQQFSVNSLSDIDRKNIKKSVSVMVESLTRIAAEQDLLKGESEALYASLGMPAKLTKKLARASFKASFDADSEEFRLFETLFETVVKK